MNDLEKLETGDSSSHLTMTQSRDSTSFIQEKTGKSLSNKSKSFLTIIGSFLLLFCTFGQMNAFGAFQSWYTEHQLKDHSPSTISLIGSAQMWAFFFSGAGVGRLYDRYGPTLIMTIGTVVYVFSIMMTSLCRQYYQYLLSQGILFGIGLGLLYYPCLASVSSHFSKYRATAVGIAVSGSSTGGVVFPIILRRLFDQVGFANTVRISGCICLACCVFALFTVTARPHAENITPEETKSSTTKSFKDMKFMLLVAGSFFVSLGLFIPYFYIVNFSEDHHVMSSPIPMYILAIMNAGGFLGRIIPSFFSDRLGRFNLLIPCALLAGISCLALWFPAAHSSQITSTVLEVVFSATYGFFSGGFISLINVCVIQISDSREVGSRMGLLYCLVSFPTLAGGPVAGALLQHTRGSSHPYDGMILFSGATLVVGTGFIIWTKLRIDSSILALV